MTETPGAVIRVDGRFAYVEIGPRVTGCGRCHEAGGCGGNRLDGGRDAKRVYRLPNDIGAKMGDDVMLAMPDGALLRASLLAYFLPVVLVIASAGVGAAISGSESVAIVAAAVGLALGVALTRYGQARMLAAREPLLSMRIKTCAFTLPKERHSC